MKRSLIFTAIGAVLHRRFARIKTADAAKLYSFFWNQSSENADACFMFSFGAAQESKEAQGHYLNCEFRAPDGEFVECGDVIVTDKQWSELETVLCGLSLPPYSPPDPYISDAADSRMEICRMKNGERITESLNGEYAHEFHSFLMKFIGQITG